jgi:hypothetical protein
MSSISVLDEAAYPVGSRSAMPGGPPAMVQHYFVAALIPLVASSRPTEQKPQRSDAIALFQFPAVPPQNADDLVAFTATDLSHRQAVLHSPLHPWPYH